MEQFFPARRDDAGRKELWASLALRHCRGLGLSSLNVLLNHFGSAYVAVQGVAAWSELGISSRCVSSLRGDGWREKAREEWDAARRYPAGLVCWSEPAYPAWLRTISDAPAVLYFLGDPGLFRNVAVAVVGRRECSVEGLRATVHIARGIAEAGVTIVSGMARGVDRAAHLAGLEGPGGSIGVLATGIDMAYPKSNADLYTLMREQGLLVSEYPPGFAPTGRFFPVRNRIISGLSKAVVVTEAAVRSGSLNTARHALEQDRELMAVPGPVTSSSAKGCQELVRRGAKPVFCADDVLRELVPHLAAHARAALEERDGARFMPRGGAKKRATANEQDQSLLPPGLLPWGTPETAEENPALPAAMPKTPPAAENLLPTLSGQEGELYALLKNGTMHIDDICRRLGQSVGIISGLLTMLEVKGHIRRLPGMVYAVR